MSSFRTDQWLELCGICQHHFQLMKHLYYNSQYEQHFRFVLYNQCFVLLRKYYYLIYLITLQISRSYLVRHQFLVFYCRLLYLFSKSQPLMFTLYSEYMTITSILLLLYSFAYTFVLGLNNPIDVFVEPSVEYYLIILFIVQLFFLVSSVTFTFANFYDIHS